jgi:hypothetical protein
LIPRNEISKQRIRDWMAAHPDEAAKVRATNRSYVFFRVTGLSNDGEPIGAQGVPLTPGRSIAVDRLHEYGTPFFIEANLPSESGRSVSPFGRLMIAQDTGSAIVGPARADLYWGAGDNAERIASRIRHPGHFVMLVPREFDLLVAGSEIPLPVPKPKIATLQVKRQDGKANSADAGTVGIGGQKSSPAPKVVALEAGKQDLKGKVHSAHADATPTGRMKSAPEQRPKIAALEAGKHNSKGKANIANASAIAATSEQKRSLAVKSPTSGIEVKKHGNGRMGRANGGPPAKLMHTREKSAGRPTTS